MAAINLKLTQMQWMVLLVELIGCVNLFDITELKKKVFMKLCSWPTNHRGI